MSALSRMPWLTKEVGSAQLQARGGAVLVVAAGGLRVNLDLNQPSMENEEGASGRKGLCVGEPSRERERDRVRVMYREMLGWED